MLATVYAPPPTVRRGDVHPEAVRAIISRHPAAVGPSCGFRGRAQVLRPPRAADCTSTTTRLPSVPRDQQAASGASDATGRGFVLRPFEAGLAASASSRAKYTRSAGVEATGCGRRKRTTYRAPAQCARLPGEWRAAINETRRDRAGTRRASSPGTAAERGRAPRSCASKSLYGSPRRAQGVVVLVKRRTKRTKTRAA